MTGNGSMPEGQVIGEMLKSDPGLDKHWILRTLRHMSCVRPDGPNGNGEFFYHRVGGDLNRCKPCDQNKECQIRQRMGANGHK